MENGNANQLAKLLADVERKRKPKPRSATRIIVISFIAVILAGTLLLMLPWATPDGITPLDALFTATSATCVTGLVVRDTYQGFTTFGQVVIITLIQIGGLGLVTLTSFFTLALRQRASFHSMRLASESINTSDVAQSRHLLMVVMKLAALFEGAGALLLMPVFVPRFGAQGIFVSIFIAISAFCNAGFDLLGTQTPYASLTEYAGNWYVQSIIMFLIIAGGLGFLVWHDLGEWRKRRKLTLHTKVVLFCTAILIVGGTMGFAFLEWSNPVTLGTMGAGDKIVNSMFQSVSARTAGFNTVDLAGMQTITKCMMCLLMFIGAAPGGTGGGIKVTTFSVILVTVASVVTGRDDAVLFRRRIDKKTVYRALAISVLSSLAVILATLFIFFNTSNVFDPLNSLFEAVSAFATVGLSVGVTANMEPLARFITIVTMFIGRVGPVSLAISLAASKHQDRFEVLPEGKISVG